MAEQSDENDQPSQTHRDDCPAAYFTDHPERCRCAFMAMLDEAQPDRHRVTRTREALYSKPRTLRKRRRCGGHLATPHMIEAGEQAVWSSLPPDSEIGNEGWWHAVFCMDCAPADVVQPPGTTGGAR